MDQSYTLIAEESLKKINYLVLLSKQLPTVSQQVQKRYV